MSSNRLFGLLSKPGELNRAGGSNTDRAVKSNCMTAFFAIAFLTFLPAALWAVGSVSVTVHPEATVDKPSGPLIFGNFIESGFGRQVDGMWAEMLFNPSFEDITPYKSSKWGWLGRSPESDLTQEDWWHSGYEEPAWYVFPRKEGVSSSRNRYWDFHHGLQSATLVNSSQSERAFLAQDQVYVRPGTYRFSGYMRTGEIATRGGGHVAVMVGIYEHGDMDRPVAEMEIQDVDFNWYEYNAELTVGDFEGFATFAISIPPRSNLVMDGFTLKPADNISGWRRETVQALKRVNPTILRFPGGCYASFYNWRDGIGPRSERMPRESVYWGGLEDNAVGTVEFIELCSLIGSVPFLCVNVMTGTPAEAAAWVAYCNAPDTHPMGALRKEHGHSEPFGVKYWELDNETYRKYGPLQYAQKCVAFAEAMRAVDPDIKIVMVAYWRFRQFLPEMLEIAGEHIDLVADRGLEEGYLRGVLDDIRSYNERTGRDVRLCNTEWLAPSGDVPVIPDALNRDPTPSELSLQNRQIRWRYAMNAARQLLVFQRLGGDFVFANFNNLANTWGQNVIECSKSSVWLSATGRVFELMSRMPSAWPLRTEHLDAPELVIQAALDEDKQSIGITVINYRNAEVELVFDLDAFDCLSEQARIFELSAPSLSSFNSETKPNEIQRNDSRLDIVSDSHLTVTARPYSVTCVVLDADRHIAMYGSSVISMVPQGPHSVVKDAGKE